MMGTEDSYLYVFLTPTSTLKCIKLVAYPLQDITTTHQNVVRFRNI